VDGLEVEEEATMGLFSKWYSGDSMGLVCTQKREKKRRKHK